MGRRLSDNFSKTAYDTPRTRYNLKTNEDSECNEKLWALSGLFISFLVISTKILTNYRQTIEKAILEQKLISYEVFTEDGTKMLLYSWKTAVKYSNVWLPILCGILSSYFTWIMVYLDSNIPGVQPPSPLSPKKYKMQSGHTFHLNYVFALLVGVLVFGYMYFRGVSIQY